MLYGKNVVLGVSGGIAVYKACEIVSRLKKSGANVDVIMTDNAREFVTPLTFQTLAKSAVVTNAFEPVKEFDINHISLAKKADILVVAPATANVIAKFAEGIADDMLTTTYLASNAQKLICPAMNCNMYDDVATQKNMQTLRERGVLFCDSAVGLLACGDVGKGRMAEPCDIVKAIVDYLTPVQDFENKRVLITSGGTEEKIDGVRVIANHSSGKMGKALAEAVADRGGSVVFVYGNVKVDVPKCVEKAIHVTTTQEMLDACNAEFDSCDVAIMAAAPADYKVKNTFSQKVKSDTLTLELVKNPDIAKTLGEKKGERKLVVFSAETENLIENAKGKLKKKHADLVVANDVTVEGAGFDVDTNVATIIDNDGNEFECGKMSKRELADVILDKVNAL
ncbi:MAG TPA: bifunctional phosphopantothenoylcysteine decarboxylase/phosphopantothenate--cysteine ligase CoaBC [Clostridiales bacterium]|nr:bifunctional phosphopantothenoylcysteine decarboxylase/phosphopantothenate--cysteine ligase CoaBC [Clostridiales bacterium]